MAFTDYEKALDSVQISAVLEAMRRQVVEVYCNIGYIYEDGTATSSSTLKPIKYQLKNHLTKTVYNLP